MFLKKNLIANYLGQGWTALMGIAFVPVYIKYLGIEAYGLIGLFAMLQAWLSLLDLGMTPTLSREIARKTAGKSNQKFIRDLLRSIEIIAVFIAIVIVSTIALGSNWIATNWLQSETLSIEVVAKAFVIMGVISALRFVEAIYRSAMIGLQQQVLFNSINAAMATLRSFGAVGILAFMSQSLDAFFIWQGTVSFLTVIILASYTYHSIPKSVRSGRFSWEVLSNVWRFAGGMLLITLISLLLTQADKIILSKLLDLREFAYYNLASVLAGSLAMLIGPISQAYYPRLCELNAQSQDYSFNETYHTGAQLISVIVGTFAIMLILFSEKLLFLWTNDELLSAKTSNLLALLAIGNLLNGLYWIPYNAQLAYGWTGLTIVLGMIGSAITVPSTILLTLKYGAKGAAYVWILWSFAYLITGVYLMSQKILKNEGWNWAINDTCLPLCSGALVGFILKIFIEEINSSIYLIIALMFTTLLVFFTSMLSADRLRSKFKKILINKLYFPKISD